MKIIILSFISILFITSCGGNDRKIDMVISAPPTNTPPVAENIELTIESNTSAEGRISVSDVDGDNLQFTVITPPENGRFTVNNDGSFEYTQSNNFTGEEQIAVSIFDGVNSIVMTITIFINESSSETITENTNALILEANLIPPSVPNILE